MRPLKPLLLGVCLLAPSLAAADIPPPPDSPDAHCTLVEQCPNGEFCPWEFSPYDMRAAEHVGEECRAEKTAKGLLRRCRSKIGYSGQELFCPPGETGTWSPPDASSPRDGAAAQPADAGTPTLAKAPGCSTGARQGTAFGFSLAVLLVLLVAARRRPRA